MSKEHQLIVDEDDATTVDDQETITDELDGKEAVEVVCTVADTISPDDPKTVEEDMELKQEQLSTSIHHDRRADYPLSAPSSPILLASTSGAVQGRQETVPQSLK